MLKEFLLQKKGEKHNFGDPATVLLQTLIEHFKAHFINVKLHI